MRPVVRMFVEDVAEQFPLIEPIVEIGARPAEGQEEHAYLRHLFPGREYIGCDIQEGPNVDRVEDVHALTFDDESVGTIISVETLEHVADPIRAVQEMHRVLKPGGIAALTSVMFFPIHAHPWDFWRFTPEGFANLVKPFETSLAWGFGYDLMPEGVFALGVKGPFPDLTVERLPRTAAACERWGSTRPISFGPMRFTVRELWARTLRETATVAKAKARRRLARS